LRGQSPEKDSGHHQRIQPIWTQLAVLGMPLETANNM
jgi:hypothetical protein